MWGGRGVKTARGEIVAKRVSKKKAAGGGGGLPSVSGPGPLADARGSKPKQAGRAARGAKRVIDPMPGPVALDPTVRALENLRRLRARPEARREVAEAIAPEVVRLKSVKAALGGLDEEWERVVPRELRERCWARGVSRRVLTVATEDASAMYQLSLWLRGGGEQQLRAATKQRVSRVKIELVGDAERR